MGAGNSHYRQDFNTNDVIWKLGNESSVPRSFVIQILGALKDGYLPTFKKRIPIFPISTPLLHCQVPNRLFPAINIRLPSS